MTQVTQEQARAAVLEVATSPLANGGKTLQTLIAGRYGTQPNLGEVLSQVTADVEAMVDGDPTKLREVLATQTLVLDQVFQHCIETGVRQRNPKAMTALMNVALRAQVLSRQTAHTLVQLPIKKPIEGSTGAKRKLTKVTSVTDKPQLQAAGA